MPCISHHPFGLEITVEDPATGTKYWRQSIGIRITEMHELYALLEQLQRHPHAVTAILQRARNLNRTVDAIEASDVRGMG